MSPALNWPLSWSYYCTFCQLAFFLRFRLTIYYLLEGKEQNGISYSDWFRQCNRNLVRKRILFEEHISYVHDNFLSTRGHSLLPFECSIDMQRLPGRSTRRVMGRNVFLGASTETAAHPAAWRRLICMNKCPCFSIWPSCFFFGL